MKHAKNMKMTKKILPLTKIGGIIKTHGLKTYNHNDFILEIVFSGTHRSWALVFASKNICISKCSVQYHDNFLVPALVNQRHCYSRNVMNLTSFATGRDTKTSLTICNDIRCILRLEGVLLLQTRAIVAKQTC